VWNNTVTVEREDGENVARPRSDSRVIDPPHGVLDLHERALETVAPLIAETQFAELEIQYSGNGGTQFTDAFN
jgi:hypothetical protein